MVRHTKKTDENNWSDPVFVLNKLFNFVIFVLIGLGVVFLGLFIFGIRPYVVLSGSMEPEIKTGSIVLVNQNVKFSEVEEGDVITFRSGEAMVTHRVYKIDGDHIITKGDANNTTDGGFVTASTFIGKDIRTIPKLGYFASFLHTVPGMVTSGLVLLVLVVGSILTGREDDKDKKKTKKSEDSEETE